MSEIKKETDMAVIGISEGGLEITHSGYCNMLSGKGWAPKGNKYLVSMPQLDKLGCRSTIRDGKMIVSDKEGKTILVGHMNKSDMYECRVECVKKQVSFNSQIDDSGNDFIEEKFEIKQELNGKMQNNKDDDYVNVQRPKSI